MERQGESCIYSHLGFLLDHRLSDAAFAPCGGESGGVEVDTTGRPAPGRLSSVESGTYFGTRLKGDSSAQASPGSCYDRQTPGSFVPCSACRWAAPLSRKSFRTRSRSRRVPSIACLKAKK